MKGKQAYETPSRFTASNPITGDLLISRPVSDAYAENYDRIFRKQPEETKQETIEATPAKVSSDGERYVSNEVYMIVPTPEHPAPKGVDMLLITKWGKCIIGKWNDADCVEYFPLPRRAKCNNNV